MPRDEKIKPDSSKITPMSEAFAIIPARGGSKGIPGKNLQAVGGLPLIQRTIEAAQESQYIKRVIVSTDAKEIKDLSEQCGAIAIERPNNLATDTASSESAILHVISALSDEQPLEPIIVFLQCTSPFASGQDIDQVIDALDDININSAFAASAWHGFLWSKEGSGLNHNPQHPRKRRQDLDDCFLEIGSIYAIRTNKFLQYQTRFCSPTRPVLVKHHPIEIDTPSDLRLSRAIHDAQLTRME